MADTEGPAFCESCGRELPVSQGRGRRRRYCDATCRSAARRQRELDPGREPARVNTNLTSIERHASLDIINDGVSEGRGSADPVASRIRDTAGRLVAELEHAGTGSPLAAMAAAKKLAAATNAALQEAVDRARTAGHSWREIGDVLETTRQAAFQRFGRPVDPRTGTPMSRVVPPGTTEHAIDVFADISQGRWEAATRDFSDRMRQEVTADRIATVYARVVSMVGTFERMGEPAAVQLDDLTTV